MLAILKWILAHLWLFIIFGSLLIIDIGSWIAAIKDRTTHLLEGLIVSHLFITMVMSLIYFVTVFLE